MKKKISIFALILVMLPILAVFGCGATDTFYVNVISSWTGLPSASKGGSVSGAGNYKDGSKVTLTATAKPESRFIAWVYEETILITDNSTYTIKNTGESGNIKQSTLSFNVNKTNNGKYTAVFDDSKIVYTKLSSWRITDDIDEKGVEESESTAEETMLANLYIGQAITGNTIYSAVNYGVKKNVLNHTNDVKEILKLNADSAQELVINITLLEGTATIAKTMKAKLFFAESEDHLDDENNPYRTTFTPEGVYEIAFKLNIQGEERFLIIEYSNLNKLF